MCLMKQCKTTCFHPLAREGSMFLKYLHRNFLIKHFLQFTITAQNNVTTYTRMVLENFYTEICSACVNELTGIFVSRQALNILP